MIGETYARELDRLRQEAARACWLRFMFAEVARRVLGRMERFTGPPAPSRWLVRRVGLSAAEERQVDLLRLPERAGASHFLPPNAIAVIFEERAGGSPLARTVGITVVKAEAAP